MIIIKKGTMIFLMLSVSFATHFVLKYYRKKKKNKTEIHEVLMFCQDICQIRKSQYSRCVITENMDRLLYHLDSPQSSFDICMYVITNVDILNVIIKLKYKGIQIRVIMDADMAFSNGSALRKLERQNIPIRWMKSTNLMHHKFCLIDTLDSFKGNPIVMMGSLNWTNQALNGNWEDVVVTSQIEIVKRYKEEFERLWAEFKPIVT